MTPEELRKEVGQRIRQARDEEGRSQEWLADAIGVGKGTLSKYENGHMTMGIDTIVRIGEALGRSLDYLLQGVEPEGGHRVSPRAYHEFVADFGQMFAPPLVQGLAGPWRPREGEEARVPTAKDYLKRALELESGEDA